MVSGGTGPWDVVYEDPNGLAVPVTVPVGGGLELDVMVAGDYDLISVVDNGTTCSGTVGSSDTQTITELKNLVGTIVTDCGNTSPDYEYELVVSVTVGTITT